MRLLLPPASDMLRVPARGNVRRSVAPAVLLDLYPTSRRLLITTPDQRIEHYVRTAYRRSIVSEEIVPGADRAVVTVAPPPAAATFNGKPLTDSAIAHDPRYPWRAGANLVDQCVWRSLRGDAEWDPVYGCAVRVGNRAVLIVGESGVGKTTLCLALSRLGGAIYGDEMVLVHRRTHMLTAVPRTLTINVGSFALFDDEAFCRRIRRRAVPVEALANGVSSVDARVLGPVPAPVPLRAVVIVKRGPGEARLMPVKPAHAAMMLAPHLAEQPSDLAAVARIAGRLAAVAVFRLTLERPGAAAAALVEGLSRC
jgi:hypothetical protein